MDSVHAALLRRVFSTRRDTPSADAEHDVVHPSRPPICNIGRGTCGTVYAMGHTNRALKMGSSARDILRDCRQTAEAGQMVAGWAVALVTHFAAKRLRISIPKIPEIYDFHRDCAEVVARYEAQLDLDDSMIDKLEQTKAGFIMQRIPAIPHSAREALVKQFFGEKDHDHFLHDMDSLDCLIRLYFGKKDDGAAISDLRNFPLCTDQMDNIGLDTKTLVIELAVGLAIIHWAARLDAMDCEYVLSSSSSYLPQSRNRNLDKIPDNTLGPLPDIPRRDTHIWILDFDKSSPLKLDEPQKAVRQLVVATSGNDPYFPRPDLNEDRWLQFRQAYIQASGVILAFQPARASNEPSFSQLPVQFMDALHQHYVEDANRQGDHVMFAD